MELVLLGLNLLILYSLWSYAWRPSAVDHRRDQLFDLRDEVRSWYLSTGRSLSDPTYQALRNLLNAHLSFTERLTFANFVATTIAMAAHPEVAKQLRAEVDALFASTDKEVVLLVKRIREESTTIMTAYMVESSLVLMTLSSMIWPLFVVGTLVRRVCQGLQSLGEAIGSPIVKLATVAALLISLPVRAGLLDNALNSSILEEYSFKASVHG